MVMAKKKKKITKWGFAEAARQLFHKLIIKLHKMIYLFPNEI